ncbi:MAG: hypothetical protein Q8Q03_02390 [bacterium]|nr:hypothetical protein [bacterium]
MKITKEIGRSPHVDWIIIIFSSTFLAVALAIAGIYLYNAVNQGDIDGRVGNTANSSRILDQKKLSVILERFSAKEQASEKAKAGYAGVSDPSI